MSDCGNVQKTFVASKEKKEVETNIKSIDITSTAAEKIKFFLKQDNKSLKEYGLKVSVVKDGCSGNSYTMDLVKIAPHEKAGDKIFTKDGATVIIEKLSYIFVIGSQLDYTETLLASGFQLNNPNIKKSCSCGSSFAV